MTAKPKSRRTRRIGKSAQVRFITAVLLVAASLGLTFPLSRASASRTAQLTQPVAFHAPRHLPLEVSYILQGSIIELKGKTRPSAIVMVNGKEIPSMLGDGSFTLFISASRAEEYSIAITAQDDSGAFATKQMNIPAL